jgi:alpha-L-fucosidase
MVEAGSGAPLWRDAQHADRAAKSSFGREKVAWWRDARFGLFLHWNMSSLVGAEISWAKDFGTAEAHYNRPIVPGHGAEPLGFGDVHRPRVPADVYDRLHESFYPGSFDADRWARTAADAGTRYVVMVAKHHDGFCMWDTDETAYDVTNTPFGRDVLGEVADACRDAGLRFGVYYSQRDWHHPDYGEDQAAYNEFMRAQIRELLTEYGDISVLWFDAGNYDAATWEAEALFEEIADCQPDVLVNDRCGVPGDFSTPEQELGAFDRERSWESCMTVTGHWSWRGFDTDVLSFEEALATLVYCAGGDGNLLLNVAPLPTGQLPPEPVERLEQLGSWLDAYGESVYGTRGGPYEPGEWGAATHTEDAVYLHVLDWDQLPDQLPPLGADVVDAETLDGTEVGVRQRADAIRLAVPPAARDAVDTVVRLSLAAPLGEFEPRPLTHR